MCNPNPLLQARISEPESGIAAACEAHRRVEMTGITAECAATEAPRPPDLARLPPGARQAYERAWLALLEPARAQDREVLADANAAGPVGSDARRAALKHGLIGHAMALFVLAVDRVTAVPEIGMAVLLRDLADEVEREAR
jgi:hypothetical protein